jgi:hypothetical protein
MPRTEPEPPTAPVVIYVDVEETLLHRGSSGTPAPAEGVVKRLRELHAHGAQLYLWSSRGPDDARRAAETAGVAELFLAFLPKPQLLVDGEALEDWHVSEVHPMALGSVRLADLLRERH